MSPRARRRVDHARPMPGAPGVPLWLEPHPLTPLAERERRRWSPRRHPRIVALGVALLAAILVAPVIGAALASTSPQLQPLGGGLVGAAEPSPAGPASSSGPAPSGGSGTSGDPGDAGAGSGAGGIVVDARLLGPHPTDPDGPALINRSVAPPVSSLTGYRWPISKGRISLPFKAIPGGEWINAGQRFHDGVDMASFCGAPVGAAHDGVVLAASRRFDDEIGWIGDLGPYYRWLNAGHRWNDLPIVVVIDDENGYRSIYAHFRDVTVKPGQRVRAGQLIGHEGATGHASGCHVHYGLFSPLERDTFGVRSDIVRRMHLPTHAIARVDPLAVLPGGDVALRTRNIAKAIAAAG